MSRNKHTKIQIQIALRTVNMKCLMFKRFSDSHKSVRVGETKNDFLPFDLVRFPTLIDPRSIVSASDILIGVLPVIAFLLFPLCFCIAFYRL